MDIPPQRLQESTSTRSCWQPSTCRRRRSSSNA